jgi:hypothetical protein
MPMGYNRRLPERKKLHQCHPAAAWAAWAAWAPWIIELRQSMNYSSRPQMARLFCFRSTALSRERGSRWSRAGILRRSPAPHGSNT